MQRRDRRQDRMQYIETCKTSEHFFSESRACKHVLKMQLLIPDQTHSDKANKKLWFQAAAVQAASDMRLL